jgi:hypothetical protein
MAPNSPKSYFLPTFGNIVFISILAVLVFGSAGGLLGDGDSGYHVRTGRVILETWTVPFNDIYSYHTPALEWTAHEWLAEVIMAAIDRKFGLTGVVLFFAVLLAAIHWLLYRVLRSQSDDIILCVVITLLATAASSSHWLARPHVFSLLFILVWYHLLNRFQYKDEPTLIFLPALMIAWVNLHGGFIVGLILLGLYLAGNLFSVIFASPTESDRSQQKVRFLLLCIVATTLVTFLNPVGYKILLFPFRVTSDRFVMDRVAEFLSPNFHEVLPFKYMLLTTIAALAFARRSLNAIEVGLLTLLSYMSLYSVRHVSLFAIIVAPILLRAGESIVAQLSVGWLRFHRQRNENLRTIETGLNGFLWPSLAIVLIGCLAFAGRLRYHFNENVFPVAAVEFLQRETVPGNMFNNDEFGDYLIFTAWPKYRVFMDGRSDMYSEKFGDPYLKVAHAFPGWKDILGRFNINWVFFNTESALSSALSQDNEWQVIYSDKIATIFVRKSPSNEPLLAKYRAVKFKQNERTF